MPILLDLFLTFLKIGAVSFGGGYAMIPLIRDEVVAHSWLTEEEIINFVAVSESTPGPFAINMATFVGASQGGFWGALLATLGVILPAFIVILLVATVVTGLLKFAGVKAFLNGARPVALGLILATGVALIINALLGVSKFGDSISFDWKALCILVIVALTALIYKKATKKDISIILLILLSALLGILFYGVFI